MKLIRRLLSAIVIASAPPALAQEPFVLEREASYQVAFGDQFYGAVTAGPGEYFAVWMDLRVGGANAAGYDLYAQRIRPDGMVVHPGSIELLRDHDRHMSGLPAAAWNGEVYLVVWHEAQELYGMRVSAEGAALDEGGFVLGAYGSNQGWPAVASDGDNFLIVAAEGGSVLGQRVSGEGTLLDPAPFTISSGAGGLGYPKVAYGAGVYLAAWAQAPAQAIRAARITRAGEVLDFGGVNISGGGTDVDAHVDFDGENFYVNWQRADGPAWDLWGVHVSAEAVPGQTRLLVNGNTFGGISGGQMAFNGSHHIIAIITGEPVFSNTDQYALMVDKQGFPVGGPFPVSTIEGRSQRSYGAASVGSQFFILWEGNRLPGVYYVYDTEGARIDANGNVLDTPEPIAVSTGAAWQIQSATSFDGNNFLSVFEDWRAGPEPVYYPSGLYAVRVTPEGEPIEDSAFQVASPAFGPGEPDSTFGAGQHAVVWQAYAGSTQVRMARILPDGTVLDPNGLVVFANEPSGETFFPKIAWNGDTYGVIWYDSYLPQGQQPLQYALVRPDGTLAKTASNVPNSLYVGVHGFEIGSNGDEFLIAWAGGGAIRASLVGPDGAFLGTKVIQSTDNWIVETPAVGFNGQSYLVAWAQGGPGGYTIYARLVAPDGTPLGSTFTVEGPLYGTATQGVLTVGADFIVVYIHRYGGALSDFDFSSVRIDASGNIIEGPTPFLERRLTELYSGLSPAMTPGGTMLGTVSLWAGNPYNGPRVHGLVLSYQSSCYADFTGDGQLDLFDFLAFVNAFDAQDAEADCTTDGAFDVFDFLCFVNAFNAGC